MAFVHQFYWLIQYFPLESSCLSSTFSSLYVPIFEKNSERGLDVFGWNLVVYNRLVLVPDNKISLFLIKEFVLIYIRSPGSEAMFADLGHFSQLSIKV